jgi:lipoic acid synthetase
MVGLGETEEEIYEVMDDLLKIGCKIITIGQYLQPTPKQIPVDRYVSPGEFERYKQVALQKGFDFVESGALVRSSYHAERHIIKEHITEK